MGELASELEALERMLIDASVTPMKISYAVMKSITNNFSQVIGQGGFGVVFLGVLQNGKVAVKKLSVSYDFSDNRFQDEVTCLITAKHKNIVRFLGYCADTQGEFIKIDGKYRMVEAPQRLLCFEYVPNGNIHQYLKENTHGVEWNTCYKMIMGICKGLHHLHKEHITHLDLKPENILLDDHLEPKITDFGLSKCFDEKQSRMFTKNLYGTLGYVAPEFIDKGEISFKSDIFSLGIIMIKLLTGSNEYNIVNWHQSIDVDHPQMKKCIEIARACVNSDQNYRPTIGEIILELNETGIMIQNVPSGVRESENGPGSSACQIKREVHGRIVADTDNTDLFNGLFIGDYGLHGPEIVQLHHKFGHWYRTDDVESFEYVEAVKLTGDHNVPAGKITFRAKIGKGERLENPGAYAEEFGVIETYKGQGRIAKPGFTNPEWVDGKLLVFNDKSKLGFVWSIPGYTDAETLRDWFKKNPLVNLVESKLGFVWSNPGYTDAETIFSRIITDNSRTDPFNGLYVGKYGLHGPEVVQLCRKFGHWNRTDDVESFEYIEAVKLTGDHNVPAGQITFRAKIENAKCLENRGAYPKEFGEEIESYEGQGRVANPGFTNSQWVDGVLVLGKGNLGFVWNLPERSIVLFEPLNSSECAATCKIHEHGYTERLASV